MCIRDRFYTVHRLPRLLSDRQRRVGPRSSYIGSETYLALVDADETPYSGDLRQLAVATLCTNRDLPLQMPIGRGDTDFTLASGAPVSAVRCPVSYTHLDVYKRQPLPLQLYLKTEIDLESGQVLICLLYTSRCV